MRALALGAPVLAAADAGEVPTELLVVAALVVLVGAAALAYVLPARRRRRGGPAVKTPRAPREDRIAEFVEGAPERVSGAAEPVSTVEAAPPPRPREAARPAHPAAEQLRAAYLPWAEQGEAAEPPVSPRSEPEPPVEPAPVEPASVEPPPVAPRPVGRDAAGPRRRGGRFGSRTARSPEPERAVGYTTFVERKRAISPESRHQARRIRAACQARGMVLHQLVGDVESYSGPDLERPGLTYALELLASGKASCLLVAGLDRLSTSAANLGALIDRLDELGARLVVIDIELDTRSDEGTLAARALARVGSLERESRRPSVPAPHRRESGLAAAGRPAVADRPLLARRIATMRASGMTLQAIADTLNREGVPTIRGGALWRPSSVQAATGYKRPGRGSGPKQTAAQGLDSPKQAQPAAQVDD